MPHEIIDKVKHLVSTHRTREAMLLLKKQSFHSAASIIGDLPNKNILILSHINNIPESILYYLEYETCSLIVSHCDENKIQQIVSSMHIYNAVCVTKNHTRVKKIMLNEFEKNISYSKNSIGQIHRHIPHVLNTDSIEKAKNKILQHKLYEKYPVCDKNNNLIGSINLEQLISEKNLSYNKSYDYVYDTDTIRQTIYKFNNAKKISDLFVINKNKSLIGVLKAQDIIDMPMLSVESANHVTILTVILDRLKWISVTVVNVIASTAVVSQFEHTIGNNHDIPIVMTIVAAMGGASGAQTVNVVVQMIAKTSINDGNVSYVVAKESIVGAAMGIICGIALGIIVAVWKSDITLAIILFVSVSINMLWAGFAASVISICMDKLNMNPELSASPILATATDTLGYAMFLILATLFLLQ